MLYLFDIWLGHCSCGSLVKYSFQDACVCIGSVLRFFVAVLSADMRCTYTISHSRIHHNRIPLPTISAPQQSKNAEIWLHVWELAAYFSHPHHFHFSLNPLHSVLNFSTSCKSLMITSKIESVHLATDEALSSRLLFVIWLYCTHKITRIKDDSVLTCCKFMKNQMHSAPRNGSFAPSEPLTVSQS